MPRWPQLVLFLSIAVCLTAGLHYYFWARLVRDTGMAPPWRGVATATIAALGVSVPLMLIGWRFLPHGATKPFAWPVNVWMGMMMFLSLALFSADLLRLAARVTGVVPLDNPERRQLFLRVLGAGAASAAAGLGALSIQRALGQVVVKPVEVRLARLPAALDGLTIAQLTDVHVGPTIGRAFIEDIVRRTNALAPDLIAITGDLVDGSLDELAHAVAPLADLRARLGVYFVTGNHEYYTPDIDAWLAHLGTLGVRVLRNERVSIGGGDAAGFDLAGIDDHNARGMRAGHGPDLEAALAGRDPTRELVLLAHQPLAVREAASRGVGLQLSGHTHGGQIWPWKYLVQLQQPYLAGLLRVGDTQLYVSSGTGYWGPPMRLGTEAEIAHITLRRAA